MSRWPAAFLAALLAASWQATGDSNSRPFAPGETLTYGVNWSIFNAGKIQAVLGTTGNREGDEYVVKTTARSQGMAALFFNVQDEFLSVFNPETACSRRISKSVNEGGRHRKIEIVFDQERNKAVVNESDPTRPKNAPRRWENEIPPCVQDIISAFYYARRQPLEVGTPLRLPVNDGGKTYEVVAEVQAREQVKTGIGIRWAFRVEPKVFGELFKRKGRMQVWFSDDNERLPLKIKVSISVGSVTGTIESVTTEPRAARAQ